MLVAGCVRFVGKDFFVFAFVENTAVRIRSGNSLFHHLRLAVPAPGIVIVKGLLVVRLSVLVYLFKQFMSVPLRFFGNGFACLLFQVCTRLYVCTVYENRLGIQVTLIRSGF